MIKEKLNPLICGDFKSFDSLNEFYEVISENVNTMASRIERIITEDNEEDFQVLMPFLLRNLLETTCNSILGRLDPFRIIYVHRVQKSDKFEVGVKVDSALSWASDIFGNDSTKTDQMWKPEKKFDGISRALFSPYFGQVYWNVAFNKMIDDGTLSSEEALSDYRQESYKPEIFIQVIRSKCSTLYSSLSKGIHSELLINKDILYDRDTVVSLINDTIEICSLLGLLTNYIDICHCNIDKNIAYSHFKELYNWRETNV